MEIRELTEYERVRQPQEINIDHDLTNSLRPLYKEIICPLCNDILQNTMAAKECLHRFCGSCILNSLKTSKKECPVCFKKLSSQSYIKEDPNFDQLIEKIYNGERDNRRHKANKLSCSPLECEVILRPLKDQTTRYIKCSSSTTIDHLSKYLSMRPEGSKEVEPDNDENYIICIVKNSSMGEYEVLSGNECLADIRNSSKKFSSNRPIELYFYARDNNSSSK